MKEAEQEKQSLMARIHQVEEFEAKLKQEEEELAKKQNEEKKDPEKEELMKEEAFLKVLPIAIHLILYSQRRSLETVIQQWILLLLESGPIQS